MCFSQMSENLAYYIVLICKLNQIVEMYLKFDIEVVFSVEQLKIIPL